jgi:trehalose 6-phosphate phosphatase
VDWDKGRAIDWILRRFEGPRWPERRSTLGVLYLGDDETDEEAFRRLRSKALTVRVGGRGPTAAAHRVLGTKQVVELMEMLVSLAPESAR